MADKDNAPKKLFYILILSCIPIFFTLSLTGLYFIQLEEWIVGDGEIIPVNTNHLSLTQESRLEKIYCRQGDLVKKGQLIATFSPRVHNETVPLDFHAGQDGIITSSLLKETGLVFKKNTLLVTIASNETRTIQITIAEKDFSKLNLDLKTRYEPNTVSINANDYYWGQISRINPIATSKKDKKNKAQFFIESTIKLYGDQKLTKDALNKIPFGSTGKVSIAIGKRSLLLQLIGWN